LRATSKLAKARAPDHAGLDGAAVEVAGADADHGLNGLLMKILPSADLNRCGRLPEWRLDHLFNARSVINDQRSSFEFLQKFNGEFRSPDNASTCPFCLTEPAHSLTVHPDNAALTKATF